MGDKGPAPSCCLSSREQNVSCPWSPKYPLAPSASPRNPHRAQPCRPVTVPAGHCCGTGTVIRVHTWRCSFRTLSAAFAASFYLAMPLCARLCAKVGTFGSLECQEPSHRWLGARFPPHAPPKPARSLQAQKESLAGWERMSAWPSAPSQQVISCLLGI